MTPSQLRVAEHYFKPDLHTKEKAGDKEREEYVFEIIIRI
jgi:predicted metal-dependent hydrolase